MAAPIESTLPIESAAAVESPAERAGAIAFLVLVIVLVLLITVSAFFITRAQILKKRQARAHPVHPLDNVATDGAPLPCLDCTIRIGAWHAARTSPGQSLDIEAGPLPCLGCRIRIGGWHAVRAHAARYAPGERFEMVSYATDEAHAPAPANSDATKARMPREEDVTESAH